MRDGPQPLERPWLARLLFDHYPLKLLSGLLAIALFSLVHSDQDAQRTLYLDVVALLPPPTSNRMLVSDLPAQVRVTLRGSRSRVGALQRDDFAPIQMDLRDPSRRVFYFDRSAIDASGPIHVIGIEPASIDLVWVMRVERRVPVRPRLRGEPEQGYSVKKPLKVTPAIVTIYGPKEEVSGISEVFTDEIPVEVLGKGIHERRIQLQPLSATHVRFKEDPNVDVQLEIIAQRGERVLRHLELAVLGAAQATLRPNVVSVTLSGPVGDLSQLEAEEIVPFVDLSTLPQNAPFSPIEVKLRGVPEGSSATRISPPSVLAKRAR